MSSSVLAGSWGKRENWRKLKGLWGKRSAGLDSLKTLGGELTKESALCDLTRRQAPSILVPVELHYTASKSLRRVQAAQKSTFIQSKKI